jgi:hypothetical protein
MVLRRSGVAEARIITAAPEDADLEQWRGEDDPIIE